MQELLELQRTEHWSTGRTEAISTNKITALGLEIQTYGHHSNMLRYILKSSDFLTKPNAIDLIAKAIKKPVRVHTRISPNSAQFLQSWTLNCLADPVEFAKAVSTYFTEDPANSRVFSGVTFPSMYHHFITNELASVACDFLETLFNVADINLFSMFFASFLLTNHGFIGNLWSKYSDLELATNPVADSDYMTIFISALESSATLLTKYNLKIIDLFYKRQPEKMAATLVQDVLIASFLDYFQSHDQDNDNHPLIQNLVYAATKPTYSRFNLILGALQTPYPCFILPHEILQYESRTPMVLASHECLLLQKIIINNEKLRKFKVVQSLLLKDSLNNDFEPLFFEIAISKHINLIHVNIPRIIFPKLEKKKNQGKQEYKRYWNMVKQELLNPLEIFTSTGDTIQTKNLIDKIKVLKDPGFQEYACSDIFDVIVGAQDYFEMNVELLDASTKIEKLNTKYESYFMDRMSVVWHTIFSNEVLLGPDFVVSRQKKRRNSFASFKIKAEELPQPPVLRKAVECPLRKLQPIIVSNDVNEKVVNQSSSLIVKVEMNVEGVDMNEKMHKLLTKVVMPSARLCIYMKCFDDNLVEKSEKLSQIITKVSKTIKTVHFESELDEHPINSLMIKFLNESASSMISNVINYYKRLEIIKRMMKEVCKMKNGSASYAITRIAITIESFVAKLIPKTNHYFYPICSSIAAAAIVESENYDFVKKYLLTERLWTNYPDFHNLCVGDGQDYFFLQTTVFEILNICGKDVIEKATDFIKEKVG
ncbi:hypothetical protein TVAG_328630 [Trichomonas vaginalis G3]|uniref:Uncharacterized protein n=1 Tax=Trichomonas vaginalis (strain ATCC PRA-98 / G3) TaxID=412133 RepID=A2F4T8_TRIV3|nr:hypothetical protein TVAGG3_0149190 [Trichomonas vaginalis G3]EAY00101.1 hypothetical protein TVAG_328630 [Trichomonas vaginalis G3]KAI5547157.1 hypothetical protein TVAGG3_0149190 [Trichomonas vaginalis G3]|eukprot:XP_001313030.1 hypothetical protein [Trichomonas vaginalis G3]